LPKSDVYLDIEPRFRREQRIGLGGYASATLEDPRLAAAQIAHDATIQSMRPEAVDALIATRWAELYGQQADRFPIDLEWRFDAQFVSDARVLDPAEWTIRLETAPGGSYAPLAATKLRAENAPRDGYWEGVVRLWFPWRDPVSTRPLLGGENTFVRLALKHKTGEAAFTWRFRTAF
jgi:hypothetical protein